MFKFFICCKYVFKIKLKFKRKVAFGLKINLDYYHNFGKSKIIIKDRLVISLKRVN